LQLHRSQSFFSFKPHITIARGLTEEKFKSAIADFQGREYSASFIACGMMLLKRSSPQDNYLVLKEFEWTEVPVFTY
jgi:2'-5' RNA ligase